MTSYNTAENKPRVSNWLAVMVIYGMILVFILYSLLHAAWPRSGTPSFSDIALSTLYILGLFGWPMGILALFYIRSRHGRSSQTYSNFETTSPVIHTNHSEIRKNERGIPEYEIAKTVNYPQKKIFAKGHWQSYRYVENSPDLSKHYLVVIHTFDNVVITAFWENMKGLKKRGFATPI